MNTNEIPIKLPERDTRKDDRFHVIHEDDIYNDDELILLERRREEYTSYRSFFLSCLRISIGEKDGGEAKSDEKRACTKTLLCVFLSLFWSLSMRQNGKGLSILVARSRECRTATRPRRSRNVSFVLTTRVHSNT